MGAFRAFTNKAAQKAAKFLKFFRMFVAKYVNLGLFST